MNQNRDTGTNRNRQRKRQPGNERDGDRQRWIQKTNRQREIDTNIGSDRDKPRDTKTDSRTDTEVQTERNRQTEIGCHREPVRYSETDRKKHRYSERQGGASQVTT